MGASATIASPIENVQVWNRLHAEGYFAKHPRYKERLHTDGLERTVGMLEPRPSDVLLEIGCGYGRLLWHLLPRVARVIGVDLAAPPLAEARELLKGRGAFELVQGDGMGLSGVADGAVTGAYAFTVFQHMTREGACGYVREVGRVLAPGGRACFQFFSDGSADREILTQTKEQSISYSATQVCEAVERAGLRVERFERECLDAVYPGRGFSWLWVLGRKA
jgi:cyclopropane fatty-acyl-phospholipid synthase-like methyltransferase